MNNKMSVLSICMSIFLITAVTSYSQTEADQILLKNYRPKSIFKVPETYVEKAKYPIFDMHSHPYAKTSEEIDLWVETMDKVGIEKTILLTKSHGAEFDSIVSAYSKYPDRFDIWCGIDYTGYDQPGFGPNAVAELERCYKAGAKGVGELGDKGKGLFYCEPKAYGMHADDPRMDLIWEKCADLGIPVNIHVGEPQWFYEPMDSTNDGLMTALEWRLDNQAGILSLPEVVKTLENAIAKHPRTIFIACHLANCNHDLEALGRLFDKYSNLYADFSARYAENAPVPKYTSKFFNKYQDRLLYGTDLGYDEEMYKVTFRILESEDEHFYEYEQFGYHWPLNGLGLNDNVLLKIYRENALKVISK